MYLVSYPLSLWNGGCLCCCEEKRGVVVQQKEEKEAFLPCSLAPTSLKAEITSWCNRVATMSNVHI